ncbi:MAG TPA: alpha/beta fold hydrolase [Trebonia sp.]
MTEPASPQVLLVVELTTRPGAQREMREALDRLVDATRQENGVVRFEVGLDPDDETRALGYEVWASQDALDEHAAKAHTREFKARVRELVVDPAAPMRTGRWRPMREELPAAYVPGTPGFAPPTAPPPGFTSERRLVNDVRMHYVIGGSGTPVVLLHGFPNTWHAWRDVMPRLAERHTVIALDLRGLGDSDPGTQPNDVPCPGHSISRSWRSAAGGPSGPRLRRTCATARLTCARRSSRIAGTMSQKSGRQSSPACCSASSTGSERSGCRPRSRVETVP